MNNQITSAAELAAKIEANRYDYFTFPNLEITVKYRNPDLLKLSINKTLPSFIALRVIESYKEALSATDLEEYQKSLEQEKLTVDDEMLVDLTQKGYNLLTELCISHTILDGQSDFENNVISWKDIPEEDALAFLLSLIQKVQTTYTKKGGEVTSTDVTDFPDGERITKRSSSRKNGKAIRQSA